jgi:hypothetical protein
VQKLLKQFTLDRILLLSVIGLAVAAHFLPVLRAEVPEGGPERNVFGWELAHGIMKCLYGIPYRLYWGRELFDRERWDAFRGCLSIALLWLGVVVLLLGKRLSSRQAGMIAALAAVYALCCILTFLPTSRATLLLGSYLWMASIGLLMFAGIRQAWTRDHSPRTLTGALLIVFLVLAVCVLSAILNERSD